MGCDIHIYIEYRTKHPVSDYDLRWGYFGGRINPSRCYSMFSRMAGVRSGGEAPMFKPKGMPDDTGYHASNDNRIYICDTDPGKRWVTSEMAARWVERGSARYIDIEGKHTWVTNPDWHSHSWLSTEEYRRTLEGVSKRELPEYFAILAALEAFEGMGFDARIVFWFDN